MDVNQTPVGREEWLNNAVDALRPLFAEVGATVPDRVRVTVGFPGGRGPKTRTIGQCWATGAVADGIPTVFISPVLSDPVIMLSTLVHELVHAVDNCVNGHKRPFARIATAVGLTGKMTATVAGDALRERLESMAEGLGPIDHGALNPSVGLKKQTTRMLKVACPVCGCVIRMTQKWLSEAGTPSCGCGTRMEVA